MCVCVVCLHIYMVYVLCYVFDMVWCDGCVHAHVCVHTFAYVHVVYVECMECVCVRTCVNCGLSSVHGFLSQLFWKTGQTQQ